MSEAANRLPDPTNLDYAPLPPPGTLPVSPPLGTGLMPSGPLGGPQPPNAPAPRGIPPRPVGTKPKSKRGVVVASVIILLAVVLAGAVGGTMWWGVNLLRDAKDLAEQSIPLSAAPGTCWSSTENSGVEVSCAAEHEFEVMASFVWLETSYPGSLMPVDVCQNEFDAFVRNNPRRGQFQQLATRPSEASWEAGNRDGQFVVFVPLGTSSGSARGN